MLRAVLLKPICTTILPARSYFILSVDTPTPSGVMVAVRLNSVNSQVSAANTIFLTL
ncbi:hypothetical protein OSCI_780034 [Kamptonema sp. PCC 6506]|nr:hypothetical protein OSCI_780034 [Kamptonema sp. PCC 6506]